MRLPGSLADQLAEVDGVQAVLLGEAADIEVFDPYFTIDLDVYTAGVPPSIEKREKLLPDLEAFETSPVAAMDRFLVKGLPASVHYIRSADVDRMLLRISEMAWVFQSRAPMRCTASSTARCSYRRQLDGGGTRRAGPRPGSILGPGVAARLRLLPKGRSPIWARRRIRFG